MKIKFIVFIIAIIGFVFIMVLPKLITLALIVAALIFIMIYLNHMSKKIKTGKNTVYLKTKRSK